MLYYIIFCHNIYNIIPVNSTKKIKQYFIIFFKKNKILIFNLNIVQVKKLSKFVLIHPATNVQIFYISFDLRFFDIGGHEFHLSRYLLITALYFTLTVRKRIRDNYLEFLGTKTSQKESHLPAKHSQIIKSYYR